MKWKRRESEKIYLGTRYSPKHTTFTKTI